MKSSTERISAVDDHVAWFMLPVFVLRLTCCKRRQGGSYNCFSRFNRAALDCIDRTSLRVAVDLPKAKAKAKAETKAHVEVAIEAEATTKNKWLMQHRTNQLHYNLLYF